MTDSVLTSLLARRTELAKEAKAADAALRQLLANIGHLDAAIAIYDPAKRPRKVQFSRAQRTDVSRTALGILRQATAPMTLRDLTLAVMAQQGHDSQDRKLVASRLTRVRNALYRQRSNGAVRSLPGLGQAVLWEVAK
jgi:hypothetical protein